MHAVLLGSACCGVLGACEILDTGWSDGGAEQEKIIGVRAPRWESRPSAASKAKEEGNIIEGIIPEVRVPGAGAVFLASHPLEIQHVVGGCQDDMWMSLPELPADV